MSTELKPCPHCGGKAEFYCAEYGYDGIHNAVMCSRCSACCESADEWNTRADGWISVDDILPENEVSVIIYPYANNCSEDFSVTGVCVDGEWFCERGESLSVTHWMLLPNKPKVK